METTEMAMAMEMGMEMVAEMTMEAISEAEVEPEAEVATETETETTAAALLKRPRAGRMTTEVMTAAVPVTASDTTAARDDG